jgi:CHC2 zinc finger
MLPWVQNIVRRQPMKKYDIDFKELKARIQIEPVLAMLGVDNLKREGNQLRGECPICHSKGSDNRAFSVTPYLNSFTCFGECKNKGDVIQLTACVKRLGMHAAAKILDEQFNNRSSNSSPAPAPAKADTGFDPGKYANALDPAHPKLEPLGVSPETFKAWRAGIHPGTGVLAGLLALPVTQNGKTVAYIGRSIDEDEVRIKYGKSDLVGEDYIFGEDRVEEKTVVLVADPLDVVTHENDDTSFICFVNEKPSNSFTTKQLRNLLELLERKKCEKVVILL